MKEWCVCVCVCTGEIFFVCVCYKAGAGDGKCRLCSNVRVVRKPAGSLVLATAGGGTMITIKPASVSNWEICQFETKSCCFFFFTFQFGSE